MRYTLKLFIEKANIVHSNKFSYDKTVYVKWTEKIIITCPIHGDFEQTPRDHLSGRGCNKCGRTTVAGRQRMTVERFIELSNKKHNYKFDYSKVTYVNAKTNVEIVCPKHGSFYQTPDVHLRSNHGCLKCGHVATGKQSRSNTEIFVAKASKLYPNKFCYTEVVYNTAISPITVVCNKCNNSFITTANKHLNNGACVYCDSRGFDFTKPAILYYLRVNGGQAYKIGVTNYSVEKRYSKEELARLHVLKTWEYAIGKDAHTAEQYYLNEYKHAKYNGDPLLVAGNTELFAYDILLLDT